MRTGGIDSTNSHKFAKVLIAAFLAIGAFACASEPAAAKPNETDVNTERDNGDYVDLSGVTVIETTRDVPNDLLEAYAAALVVAEKHPDDFGYPVVQEGGVVLPAVSSLAVTVSKSNRGTITQRLLDLARTRTTSKTEGNAPVFDPRIEALERITLKAHPSGANARQLDQINMSLFESREEPRLRSAEIVMTGIDASGRVVLTVHALTQDLTQFVVTNYGTANVVISVESEFVPELTYSRQSDSSAYWGGAVIYAPAGSCTSGFPWNWGSVNGMLTAGHCVPNGGTIKAPSGSVMGTVRNGTFENWNTGVGTVLMSGQSIYRGDLAFIEFNSGVYSGTSIYRGNSSSSTGSAVGEMWSRRSAIGDQFCTGGAVSGEICGWTVDQINTNAVDGGGERLVNATRGKRTVLTGSLSRGDSGGPVYTVNSNGKVAAKGIISAKGYQGLTNYALFTDIQHAYEGLPGTLRVM